MDDNIWDLIQMVAAVFFFVFALTCGIVSYARVNGMIDQFVEINMESSRRGDATNTFMEENDVIRKTDRAEIILSVLNLERTVTTTGNTDYEIKVKDGASEYTFKYVSATKLVEFYKGGSRFGKYSISDVYSPEDKVKELVEDIKACISGNYTVSYTENSLTYTKSS